MPYHAISCHSLIKLEFADHDLQIFYARALYPTCVDDADLDALTGDAQLHVHSVGACGLPCSMQYALRH